MKKVGIVDYGMGNIFSVSSACRKVGIEPVITDNHEKLMSLDGLILPGVGSFYEAMKRIEYKKLDLTIREYNKKKKPILGICLGMQLLFTDSFEVKKSKGIDLIQGSVKSIGESLLKINQNYLNIGWYSITKTKRMDFFNYIKDDAKMYFIHSYYCSPLKTDIISTYSFIDKIKFCSSVVSDNIFCFQFHPEKSCEEGLKIYKSFKDKL